MLSTLPRALRPLLLLTLAAVLSGCFQTKSLIRLNADGSGTMEETVMLNAMMMMSFSGASLLGDGLMAGGGQGVEMADDGPYSLEQLRTRAAEMGATLQSVEGKDILFGSGYVAVFAFEDINAFTVTGNPFGDMMGEMDGMADQESAPITFAFSRGNLTVRMPEPANESGIVEAEIVEAEPYPMTDYEDVIGDGEIIDEPAYDTHSPQHDPKKDPHLNAENEDAYGRLSEDEEMRQMASLFKDMSFSLTIELPDDARETNASHVNGRLLTLFDMDFSLLAENPEAFDLMDDFAGPPSVSMGRMSGLEDVPGFTFEMEREITVSF